MARANVLIAIDVDTTCILGYYLAPTDTPNQQDMLTLIDRCLQHRQAMPLTTPGLCYTPGACFPSGLEEEFPISFGTVQMDNAWMHRAHSVITLLCEQYGATLSLGLPAMPKTRHLVESVFKYINVKCSHRVASTTGSHPTDPIKESRKNRKHSPLITFQTVNEALSVILTEYNITPRESLGEVSPLALFQHHCANHFVRYVPKMLIQQWHPLIGSKKLKVHWYVDEKRAPLVNFCHARYQGPGLVRVIDDKDPHVHVQFDRNDIRTLNAYSFAGEDLGQLHAPTSWQRFPHSLATRQWIHKNAKKYHLNMRDPLSSYFRLLLENKGKPEMALSLLRVYNEFTGEQTVTGLALGEEDNLLKEKSRQYGWHSSLAHHKE